MTFFENVTPLSHEKFAGKVFGLVYKVKFDLLTTGFQDPDPGGVPGFVASVNWFNNRVGGELELTRWSMRIPLLPHGRLFWDLNAEEVTIRFLSNGNMAIDRRFRDSRWHKVMHILVSP